MNEAISLFDKPSLKTKDRDKSFRSRDVQYAVDVLSRSGVEERGAVYTKVEVVDFMLDLIGYRADKTLIDSRVLEPSFGEGDFLVPIVKRLLNSFFQHGGSAKEASSALGDCIRAVELHQDTYKAICSKIYDLLLSFGVPEDGSGRLCQLWIIQDDFLLADLEPVFTHVVGNPPYVRQELIPEVLIREYRRTYKTIFDRADLYVPFFERSLRLLVKGGKLSFICSDRWMKNRYGGPLRQLIADKFHVESYIDMMGTGAFRTEVSAYPAITTIVNDSGSTTRVAKQPKVQREYLKLLADALSSPTKTVNGISIEVIPKAIKSSDPWLLDCAKQLQLIRKLEDTFPLLEQAGCKVGIGVATGSDQVYIGSYQALDVEPDRKLPLIMAPDIRTGRIEWSGKGIINPFDGDGNLVDLSLYPKLMSYLLLHESRIRARDVAKRNPNRWYRTIDKISASLTYQPKLLIPDIKNEPNVVLDQGKYYPHHNLYWITSKEWDLRALQTVLRSSIAKLFVSAYSVKMRGGYLRYQAQNLRRICLPQWATVLTPLQTLLIELARSDDTFEVNKAVFQLYNLDLSDKEIISNLT